jgi:glycosyltransferase involved in cell wall biosynthesis
VVFDFPHSIVLAPERIPVPSVLFTHNVESWIFERHVKVAGNVLTRLLWKDQFRKMVRFERETLKRFDAVIAVSDIDAGWFRDQLGLDNVSVIPTGVDLDFFQWQAPSPQPRVMFIGSMDWPANQDGVRFFMDEVWPRVLERVPAATMKVIGRSPPPRLVARAPASWQFTRYVDDIRPHATGSAVSVIPLRVGGGTRIKAFESMALGVPVVSTAIGVEGLPIQDQEHYLRADTAEEFADQVVQLLVNRELSDGISRRARSFVESQHSNRKVAQVFEDICAAASGA